MHAQDTSTTSTIWTMNNQANINLIPEPSSPQQSVRRLVYADPHWATVNTSSYPWEFPRWRSTTQHSSQYDLYNSCSTSCPTIILPRLHQLELRLSRPLRSLRIKQSWWSLLWRPRAPNQRYSVFDGPSSGGISGVSPEYSFCIRRMNLVVKRSWCAAIWCPLWLPSWTSETYANDSHVYSTIST